MLILFEQKVGVGNTETVDTSSTS